MNSIKDKVIVVTGASEGIGRAIAHALGVEGGAIAVCARNAERIEETVTSLTAKGIKAIGRPCDVTDESNVASFASFVKQSLGPADVLVNNAGIGYLAPLLELTTEQIDNAMAVNVRGVFLATRAFLPDMIARGSGDIVNISSIAGKNGFAGGTAYAASKHAVMGFSKSLMLEVRQHGVRVMAICPGSVDTAFFDKAGMDPANRDRILTAEDIARAVVDCVTLGAGATVAELEIRPSNP